MTLDINTMSKVPKYAVCSVSLNLQDRIRLIEVPPELVDGFRQVILEAWSKGIQDERDYHGAREFKLKGNPWLGHSDEAVTSRSLIAAVLTYMARNGWNLIQSSDTSKKQQDKDTLFFEYGEPDPEVHVFSISFNLFDRLRVIGAPQIMPTVRKAVEDHWNGIQAEREYEGSLELKLKGYPWTTFDGKETVAIRVLLNHILSDVRALGYKLYGSIDLSVAIEGRDLETWFFRRVGQNWA